ncbi:MAG: TetR/AcrR family transcriptional regulator [Planctomycetota bacterium]|jgi:AcrR family transcriptional regulator
MPKSAPDRAAERRREFLPLIARAFAELGYRRATTAELAGRCDVQENILYRLWPDKRAMFIAAIEYVYDLSSEKWEALLAGTDASAGSSAAERILKYEAEHHGEFGLYRIVFAGLTEMDDDQIRAALRRMYGRYQEFIERRVKEHRGGARGTQPGLAAWAIVGLGTVSSIARDLGLMDAAARRRLWKQVGPILLENGAG